MPDQSWGSKFSLLYIALLLSLLVMFIMPIHSQSLVSVPAFNRLVNVLLGLRSINLQHLVLPSISSFSQPRLFNSWMNLNCFPSSKFQVSITLPGRNWMLTMDSGIHGYPTIEWDNAPGNPAWGWGYCTHDSVLFPTWHRPYVALYEVSHEANHPPYVLGWYYISKFCGKMLKR